MPSASDGSSTALVVSDLTSSNPFFTKRHENDHASQTKKTSVDDFSSNSNAWFPCTCLYLLQSACGYHCERAWKGKEEQGETVEGKAGLRRFFTPQSMTLSDTNITSPHLPALAEIPHSPPLKNHLNEVRDHQPKLEFGVKSGGWALAPAGLL